MRNIALEIEYDGTNYCGWQVQSSRKSQVSSLKPKKSIQEVLEKTLRKVLQEKIHLAASGRTDAGVHAKAQVANFKTRSTIPSDKLQRALNGLLPADIAVTGVKDVSLDFHSRFGAKSKLYRYTILNRRYPSALLRNTAYFYPHPLDIRLMRKEARCLLGKHDFKSFCASGSSAKSTIRTIKRISIKVLTCDLQPATCDPEDRSLIVIDIEADGFLYNMARNIVGTLIEIGRGKFPAGSLKKILKSRNRRFAGQTAPSRGLCLLKVGY